MMTHPKTGEQKEWLKNHEWDNKHGAIPHLNLKMDQEFIFSGRRKNNKYAK